MNKKQRLPKSFYYAMEGILYVVKNERNMQIHTVVAILAIITGCWFHISVADWIILTIVIGGVFSLELINTAIEKTVDLITDSHHPLAKIAKDAAAGAVLIYAVVSVIVGVLLFSKYMF
ncbi:diacylglycerol kinase family protein [Priestia abyssalis]|uniref:diacylglycerol kinase family protein n=1 Tax=Priestia abyssalis TaxID=1221450 RepID=UPI001F443CBE|nr:diacylglycerol kinase family protein [Priestia abyssalis]